MKRKNVKRICSLLLVICIFVGMLPVTAAAQDSIVPTCVTSSDQLAKALESGAESICITEDFELDRTFYITKSVAIYADGTRTLTRSADFGGDIFIVGEKADGSNVLLDGAAPTLTLGNPVYKAGSTLVIDGNKDYMQEKVTGSVIFVSNSSTVNIYDGFVAKNSNKVGNLKALDEKYGLSYASRIGGAVAIIASGTMNVYGGEFLNNVVNKENTDTDTTEAAYDSSRGAVLYNFSNLRIYGGRFEYNVAARGGALYNYRTLRIDGGVFRNNYGYTNGGVVYQAGSQYARTIIGDSGDSTAVFENNSANNGGALYAYTQSAILIFGNAQFKNNIARTAAGGAIACYGTLYAVGAEFENNGAYTRGGAIYLSNADAELSARYSVIENCSFTGNRANSGGAVGLFSGDSEMEQGAIADIINCTFDGNVAEDRTEEQNDDGFYGGALYASRKSTLNLKNSVLKNNTAGNSGAALYASGGSKVTIEDSEFTKNNALEHGGALAFYSESVSTVYNCTFEENSAKSNGGAAYVYTGLSNTLMHSCTFKNNTSQKSGGAVYVSKASVLEMYNVSAIGNKAKEGGVMYETTTDTTVTMNGITVSGNTATSSGPIIFGNTKKALLNLNKENYTDLDVETELDDAYWTGAVVNKLTVNDITGPVPDYKVPVITDTKQPVSVNEIFALGIQSSDEPIDEVYGALPKLDNSSNFLSRNRTEFDNILGKTVTVDTFASYYNEAAHNPSTAEGILIYQALLYKQANPEKEVSIDISSFHFSIEASVCINRNSRYFGYMRNLTDVNYDEYGFVRIAYLLVTAAKMGINVNLIAQTDAAPRSEAEPTFDKYFENYLTEPCDPEYVENGQVGDYLDFNHCLWTSYGDNAATDMMHTKVCAVSHYTDMNGVDHENALWTSSINLDGIFYNGANGNNSLQTGTIVSDHEPLYRVAHNYLTLMAQYCNQEGVQLFRDYVSQLSAQQVNIILSGNGDSIDPETQIIYLGSDDDKVFELYFTPFGGDAVVWNEKYNPYCKYLRKLYESEGSIVFAWNSSNFKNTFALGKQMEDMISGAFHKNASVRNLFYTDLNHVLPGFDDLTEGVNIGLKRINSYSFGAVHNKDMLLSYVENSQRQFVTLHNSLNIHGGSMYYQSNFALVIKETECDENSVFYTFAKLFTTGITEKLSDLDPAPEPTPTPTPTPTPEVEIKDTAEIFTDITAGTWYKEYVDYAYSHDIFNGTTSTTFEPTMKMSRAQFVQVLANIEKVDTTDKNVTTSFTDVESGKWFTPAVKWASDNGIVNGTGGGKFSPDANITREDMCVMLVRYAKYKNIEIKATKEKTEFADDSKIGAWAKEAVYICQSAEIVGGKGNNTFDPKATGSRAEAATIFTRFHKNYIS